MKQTYHLGLLYLIHLLISADGVIDEHEQIALHNIKEREGIPDELFNAFEGIVLNKKEREIFETGIDLVNQCTLEEKLNIFVLLYKLSEVDGRVHVKEIRFLLYTIKLLGVEFDDVVNKARTLPSLI
ncbi:TerB family tellurite resistance protein [Fulvivirgaceae bacterium PWU4]|uniref:TerB family tellurite resistance protein n=1 Tax=Chryseosolibacter histidini TaxID=2782349 RepID=A0AAP2DP02_9BACT|nr:TerB family tellurite resistance protein [Chryseosolibacter histidini]MBT1698582.1 TerB family tellurite resistance protein [Chryseosolibacter histidini]